MKNLIVIHHSATADSGTVSWGAIRKYHVGVNKWLDIGYHYGIELVGDHYEILVGRPEFEDAAAVKEGGVNHNGLHICCIGDFDKAPPPKAQLEACARLCVSLCKIHGLGTNSITTHHQFAPYKTCPGEKFPMIKLVAMVKEKLT